MGFGLILTSGDTRVALPETVSQWLVEARVELELSKPTRFALRFEDDLCDGGSHMENVPELQPKRLIGIFVEQDGALECLVYGPVTDIKSAAVLGGAGSWVEIRGEDRRVEMGRLGVQATYTGKASAAAHSILAAYGFSPETQDTLIEHDAQRSQLSQRGTDLAFLEDIARKNNMEFWLSYAAERSPGSDAISLTETANLRTSPTRAQPGDVPQLPTLAAPPDRLLRVNPPPRECPSVNRFEAKIDFEKPTAARGFAMNDRGASEIVEQIVSDAAPVDGERPLEIEGVKREAIAPPTVTPDEAFLAQDALVFEQSWFVQVEASTSLEQAQFVILPHQIVEVSHAGPRLSGAYQVMKAVHVVNAADHLIDFTLRANGLGASA
ncbi:hypothetical protein [Aquimonas sp.]|jgi:hypothetical protein|uniref:hypothetical protein n=1 Tax=Aquimonas sp. TaxID=1872588 RepID=UPI0037C016F4